MQLAVAVGCSITLTLTLSLTLTVTQITNMPIKRFADSLARDGKLEEYMQLLVDSFNPATLEDMMCRSFLSVGYDGTAARQLRPDAARPRASVTSITSLESLHDKPITTGSHCFGCTAGAGSS